MRTDQGLDFWFLDNLRKRNNNNKTLQPRHSSACRGHFLALVKWWGRDMRIMIEAPTLQVQNLQDV